MNEQTLRGANLLAEGLAEAGITTIFSLSGNQIMPVYDALLDTDIRIIHTRHEGGAVYMAEAAAQLSGKTSIALLTAGPGFANGLSAMYTATESETPIVVLTGDSPTGRDGRGAFQELDQCAAARPMVKATFRCRDGRELKQDILRAIALAESGRPGPVHLALPDGVLRNPIEAPAGSSVVPDAPSIAALSDQDLGTIRTALQAAQSPLIVAGPAYCRPHWKPVLDSLGDKANVPIVTFESPRGLRDPRLGAFAEVLGQTDTIVAFGKPLNFMMGFAEASAIDEACKVIQVDADPALLARDRASHPNRNLTQINADAAGAIMRLVSDEAMAPHSANAWHQEVKAAVAHRPAEWDAAPAAAMPIRSVDLANAVKPLMSQHPDATLIIDGGEIGQWCQAVLNAPNAVINGPSGAIGAAIPYAIGASVTRPDQPVITILGDGTAGFYLAELETAVREQLPFVAIIGNDATWNAEHQIQLRDYGPARAHSCTLTPARYDRVAADLGGHGECITSNDDLSAALERALASGKPACINVMIDGQAAPAISRNTA